MNPQREYARRVGRARPPAAVDAIENRERQFICSAPATTPLAGDLLLDRGPFQIRLAQGQRRSASDMLVQKMYSRRGYDTGKTGTTSHGRRSITVQACHGPTVFGTLNAGFDCGTGLASDVLYRREIDAYRRPDGRVSEFTRLAVEPEHGSKDVLGALFHLTQLVAVYLDATDMFIEVNPRHVAFYRRMLHFQPAGEEKLCGRVNAPAILMHLEVAHMRKRIALYGGRRDDSDRSLYPYYCSPQEEADVLERFAALNVERWLSIVPRHSAGTRPSSAATESVIGRDASGLAA